MSRTQKGYLYGEIVENERTQKGVKCINATKIKCLILMKT